MGWAYWIGKISGTPQNGQKLCCLSKVAPPLIGLFDSFATADANPAGRGSIGQESGQCSTNL